MNVNGVEWLWYQHPTSPKMHAFPYILGHVVEAGTRERMPDGADSACGLTRQAVGEGQTETPRWPDACWLCCKALGVKTGGTRPPAPRSSEPQPLPVGVVPLPQPKPQQQHIEQRGELLGGPFDGVRLRDLRIVVHSATSFTVVGQGTYTGKTPTMASEVEHPAKETPQN